MKEQNTPRKQGKNAATLVPFIILVVIAVGAISFYGGMAYQKGHTKTSNSASSSGTSQFGQGGAGVRFQGGLNRGQRPIIGQVITVSSSSISIKDSVSGETTTLSISATTQVTNNNQPASVSDIKIGDSVLIQKSTSDTNQAIRISINPTFQGGGGGTPSTPGSSGSNAN